MTTIGIVIIVVVVMASSTIVRLARIRNGTDRWSRRHGKYAQQPLLDPAQPSPRELDQQREIAELRERLHVLERIATDGRQTHALAAEIESLRGK